MDGRRDVVHQGNAPVELAAYFKSQNIHWADAYLEIRRFDPEFAMAFRKVAEKSTSADD
ncbi:MAG: hypothetical protein ACNI3A_19565 [Desulfovibrio sp.]|uniref:hypothetical protein n=1 Tax=Desulfovibrio sp. 7SRBS1 TaxID=3378064 RepID=UPI003B4175B5